MNTKIIDLPTEIVQYILSFYEEYRLLRGQIINIAKLKQVPRPNFATNYCHAYHELAVYSDWIVKIRVYEKEYLFKYHAIQASFSISLYCIHRKLEKLEYYESKDRCEWIKRNNRLGLGLVRRFI